MHLFYCLLKPLLADSEPVSQTAYRNEITRVRRVILYLLSEPVDIYHDGILVDYGVASYNAVDHGL